MTWRKMSGASSEKIWFVAARSRASTTYDEYFLKYPYRISIKSSAFPSVNSRVGRRPLCYLAPRRRRESHSASKKRPSADASNHNDIDLALDAGDVPACDAGPSASTSRAIGALSLATGAPRTT